MSKALVIVESPAKAKTISKFLGSDYIVEASIGHIRDLPRNASEIPEKVKKEDWSKVGVNVEKNFEPLYVIPSEKKEQVKKLRAALTKVETLYLATDEDREGESISWHLAEVLKPKVPVHRLVFHEITQSAINKALQNVRKINSNLVQAQETRRVVDRLYGYEVSPLLWKKLHKRKLSAGRVQSVALRLVVERERERKAFISAGWWSLSTDLNHKNGIFQANLVSWDGKKIATGAHFNSKGQLKNKGFLVLDEKRVTEIEEEIQNKSARVVSLETKNFTERPYAPFITSTLQQESIRKFRWTAKQTMSVAQRLYESGWITYMRTDSYSLSSQAVQASRNLIQQKYGASYLPKTARVFKKSSKNAQEAHEAIRPAGESFKSIEDAQRMLDSQEARLYELIWKRTIASQMENAKGQTVRGLFEVEKGVFSASGKSYTFDGFRRVYIEGAVSPVTSSKILPVMEKGDSLSLSSLKKEGHNTRPPARYNEASLVKSLEDKGIGRPSTYASIIGTIIGRGYIFKKSQALIPTFTAFVVISLLERHLDWLVDYAFTARMEATLDKIAHGDEEQLACLKRFYLGAEGLKKTLSHAEETISPNNVGIALGETEKGETVEIRCGKYGEYVQLGELYASIPEQLPPDELSLEKAMELIAEKQKGPTVLGEDPKTGKQVFLISGPYGYYVQLGEPEEVPKKRGKGTRTINPKRVSLLSTMSPDTMDLGVALRLLELPKVLGTVEENGETISVLAATGPYGPYLKKGKQNVSLPKGISLLDISLAEALDIFQKKAPKTISLGEHEGIEVWLKSGRYGPYISDGKTNAPIPKSVDADSLDLAAAVALLEAKKAKGPSRRKTAAKKKVSAKKTTAKKTTAKKKAPVKKKAPAKKATAKKSKKS
ncbi:MAG: type I DNA topoisomerase [Myxococcota bacterium]|nr:type I DNA topoisomerase [Myxococcota bacterium]